MDRRNVGFLREGQAQRIEIDQLFAKPRVGDPVTRACTSASDGVALPMVVQVRATSPADPTRIDPTHRGTKRDPGIPDYDPAQPTRAEQRNGDWLRLTDGRQKMTNRTRRL
jgi:hypothetical protein